MNLHTHEMHSQYTSPAIGRFTIRAPEDVPAHTRLVLEVMSPGKMTPVYLPLTILG